MNSLKTLTVAALAAAALAATAVPSQAVNRIIGHGPVFNQVHFGGHFGGHFGPITCYACNLPRPRGPIWGTHPYRPWPIWGHGPRWPIFGHWHYWNWHRSQPVFLRGGAPTGPAGAAPAAAMPGPAAAAPQGPTGSCNCLTKQTLPNGAVLFQDVCTQQSAIAPPQAMSAR